MPTGATAVPSHLSYFSCPSCPADKVGGFLPVLIMHV